MKISIVTNALNQGRFLRRCMESVLEQSYRNIEYIVIDPGSTDETAEILAEYEAKGDPRLIVLREKDNGPADGLNKGFERATGDWFAYMNADDFFLEGALEQAAAAIGRMPDADCIYGDGYMTDAHGKATRRVISTPFTARSFVNGRALVLQQSTFWKADSFRRIGGFNVDNRTSWDAELLLDMSLSGMSLRHVPGDWSAFVIHPESITGSQRHAALSRQNHERMFRKVMGRDRTDADMKARRLRQRLDMIIHPDATLSRIRDKINPGHLPQLPDWAGESSGKKRGGGVRVLAKAPDDASYFFGFHDVSPWSPDDTRLLLHRIDPDIRRMPRPEDRAEILLWDYASGSIDVVGETTCWNFQQGARAMWVPGRQMTLLYNKRVGDKPGCEIVDLVTGERRQLPHAVGSIAPCGTYAMAPNFGRLGALWKAYGYSGFESAADDIAQPEDDGLWRIDLESGERQLLFSIRALVSASENSVSADTKVFVTHVSFNREGTRIVFMLRFFSKDHALYSLIYSATADGRDLKLLAQEKISHFDWIDEDNIVIWMRKGSKGLAAARKSGLLASPFVRPLVNIARKFRGRLKGMVLNESYFLMSTKTGERTPFMAGTLPQDGHPMISPDRKWMIVDEYPHPETGDTPLMLVEVARQRRIDLLNFKHDVGSGDSDLKCDLHPRWNRAGTLVGVDASERGRRRFTVVDVASAMNEGG
ncbi:glycosyltransferase family 2 protein [uncultured Martelella sp.]|uniref:glycosyltransferase family 2 protein n=1 Tax=uncultured Martelella sp. TaxID=392331 RepID=UPI0029C845ED|nr:glycosyltransferase family 2 protein [uncultured Martelella sp.]